jgi:hypothetical protein
MVMGKKLEKFLARIFLLSNIHLRVRHSKTNKVQDYDSFHYDGCNLTSAHFSLVMLCYFLFHIPSPFLEFTAIDWMTSWFRLKNMFQQYFRCRVKKGIYSVIVAKWVNRNWKSLLSFFWVLFSSEMNPQFISIFCVFCFVSQKHASP